MFRALFVYHQETLHECSFGDLCAVVGIGWSQDLGRLRPETSESDSEGEVCIKLVVFIT
jgi:hypothetical protein